MPPRGVLPDAIGVLGSGEITNWDDMIPASIFCQLRYGPIDQHEPAGGSAWRSGVDRDEGKVVTPNRSGLPASRVTPWMGREEATSRPRWCIMPAQIEWTLCPSAWPPAQLARDEWLELNFLEGCDQRPGAHRQMEDVLGMPVFEIDHAQLADPILPA